MKKEIKQRIIEVVNKNTTATIFGFVRLSMIRDRAEVPEEISDRKLKNFLIKQFENDFIGGLEVK